MIVFLKDLLDSKDNKLIIDEKLKGFTEDDVTIKSPVKVNGTVSIDSDILEISLNIQYEFTAECDRCLKSINDTEKLETLDKYKLDVDFGGDRIDIDSIVYENIMLYKNTKFLCKDDCKGLCPNCGVDLNENDCECVKDYINPKFEKLGKLLDKK